MRILFLATYFPDPAHPTRGNWALEQVQAFIKAGDEVCTLVPTPFVPRWLGRCSSRFKRLASSPSQWQQGEAHIHYLKWPYYPWHFLSGLNRKFPQTLLSLAWPILARQVMKHIERFSPDVICAHHTLVAGQIAAKIHDRTALPFIVTDHEVGDLLACRHNTRIRDTFSMVRERAHKMIVVSHQMQSVGDGIFGKNAFQTIHNGSSFPLFSRGAQGGLERATVFCCAKFYGRKDIPLLVRAFDRIAAHQPVELRIAGDGPERDVVEASIQSSRNRDRIQLLGLLPPEAVRQEMQQADIFALVGWAEPFGVVFLEAMASGLPVIVCEDAGVAEVLEDRRTAVFTKPRDEESVVEAFEFLLEDPLRMRAIGAAGQQLFKEQFAWEHVIEDYRKLIKMSDD